jgi:hypothetical protein
VALRDRSGAKFAAARGAIRTAEAELARTLAGDPGEWRIAPRRVAPPTPDGLSAKALLMLAFGLADVVLALYLFRGPLARRRVEPG